MIWRDLFRGRRQTQLSQRAPDRMDAAAGHIEPLELETLAEIERAALAIYADHGLPVRRGHYRRAPRARRWEYLGEHVDIERRWDMVRERPTGSGWRFATLEDLGRYGGKPTLVSASALLTTCRRLRERLAGRIVGDPVEDIESAIQLGVAWQRLRDVRPWREASRLRLTLPDETAVRASPPIAPPSHACSKSKRHGSKGRRPG